MATWCIVSCTKPKPILPEKNPEGYKQEEQPVYSGAELYNKKCTACHGSDGNLGVAGAKKLPQSVLSQEERESIIKNGKGTMSAFKDQLSDEEIKKVAEYTLTLK